MTDARGPYRAAQVAPEATPIEARMAKLRERAAAIVDALSDARSALARASSLMRHEDEPRPKLSDICDFDIYRTAAQGLAPAFAAVDQELSKLLLQRHIEKQR